MPCEWFIDSMWSPDDPDRERFEHLLWCQHIGVDVEDELDALRARREAEDVAYESLTGVVRGQDQSPVTVAFPNDEERLEAYRRAPIYSLDGRTGDLIQLRPRLRPPNDR